MPVTGLHHVLLTVSDVDRSARFYEDVIGLKRIREVLDDGIAGHKVLFALPDGSMLGVVRHAQLESEWFDEKCIGMDHVALSVPADELPAWQQRLDQAGVPYSAPAPSAVGETLIVLRDPDNIQLQIYGGRTQQTSLP